MDTLHVRGARRQTPKTKPPPKPPRLERLRLARASSDGNRELHGVVEAILAARQAIQAYRDTHPVGRDICECFWCRSLGDKEYGPYPEEVDDDLRLVADFLAIMQSIIANVTVALPDEMEPVVGERCHAGTNGTAKPRKPR